MRIKDLLYLTAKEFCKRDNYLRLSKTKLIKLAYLAEVFFKRNTGKRLTTAKWIFWKFGPYLMEYPDILKSDAFNISDEEDFNPIELNPAISAPYAEAEERAAISTAMDFADEDLNELLDFVYFDTEPMMEAKSRGDELNFDSVRPAETYRVIKYSVNENMKKDIKRKLQAWKSGVTR
jgi:uncharacterized phage-associated protein